MSFILKYLDEALDTVTGRYDGQEDDGKSEKGDAVDGDVNVEAEAACETQVQAQLQRDSSSGINPRAARELLGARTIPDNKRGLPVAVNLEEPSRIPSHSARRDSSEAGGSLLSSAEDRRSLLPHGSEDDNSSVVSSAGSHPAFFRPQATAREGARSLAIGQGKMENMAKEVMSHHKLQQERQSFFSGQVALEGSEQTGEQRQQHQQHQNDDEPPSLQVSLKPRSDRERLPALEAKALEEEALREEEQRKREVQLEREQLQKLEEDERERLTALEAEALQRLEGERRRRKAEEEEDDRKRQRLREAQLEQKRAQKREEDERERLMELEAEALQRLEDERQRRKAEEEDRERQRLRSAAVAAEAEAAAGRAVVEEEEKARKAQEQRRQLRLEEEEQERQRRLAVDKEPDLDRRQAEERTARIARANAAVAEAAAAAAEEKEETRQVQLDREAQALAAQEEERRQTALVERQVDNGDTTVEAGTPARGVNHEDSPVAQLPAELPLAPSAADRARAREEAWAEARMLAEGKARTQAMRVAASREGAEEGKGNATGEPSGGAAAATTVTAALPRDKGVGVRRRGGEEAGVEEGSDRSSRRLGSVAAAGGVADSRDSGAAGAVLQTAAADTGRLGMWGSLFAGGRRREGPGVGSASSVTSSQVKTCVPHAIAVLWLLRVVGLGQLPSINICIYIYIDARRKSAGPASTIDGTDCSHGGVHSFIRQFFSFLLQGRPCGRRRS